MKMMLTCELNVSLTSKKCITVNKSVWNNEVTLLMWSLNVSNSIKMFQFLINFINPVCAGFHHHPSTVLLCCCFVLFCCSCVMWPPGGSMHTVFTGFTLTSVSAASAWCWRRVTGSWCSWEMCLWRKVRFPTILCCTDLKSTVVSDAAVG